MLFKDAHVKRSLRVNFRQFRVHVSILSFIHAILTLEFVYWSSVTEVEPHPPWWGGPLTSPLEVVKKSQTEIRGGPPHPFR